MHALARLLGFLAAVVACVTVCTVPWMLGGVVPLARLVLLSGAVTAGFLSLLSRMLSREFRSALPLTLLPLIGLVILGTWQLRPVEEERVQQMAHAISDPVLAEPPPPVLSASVSPADTRSIIATLLAASVLGLVCFDHVRTRRAVVCFGGTLLLNGVVLTAVGLSHLFQETELTLNEVWSLGTKNPFATFVNPNNAAGWICLSFAIAAGWISFYLRSASSYRQQPLHNARLPLSDRLWNMIVPFFAELTAWKILAFGAMAFLAAGVAATRSRGGILALVAGVILTALLSSSLKRIPLILTVLFVCAGGTYATLRWLELDKGVVSELRTLRDLDKAAGSRPRHWYDSLHVLGDFPVTGAGLGAYRFTTLPYQSQHTGRWYRYADNNFVDLAVEGGLVGLFLFVAVGLSGIVTGLAGWRQARRRRGQISDGGPGTNSNGPFLWAVGTACLVASFTQAASGMFDYGVSMPAATSMLIVLLGMSAGCLHEFEPHSRVGRTGAVACGKVMAFSVQLCILSSAMAYLVDQRAAVEIDRSVVRGTQILAVPATEENLDQVGEERALLETRLRRRPDDAAGLSMLCRLADADFRWRVIRAEYGRDIPDDSGLQFLWQRTTGLSLCGRLANLRQQNPFESARQRAMIQQQLRNAQVSDVFARAQRRVPLMPNLAERRAALSVLMNDADSFQRQTEQALFVEPSNAETAYRLGLIALSFGETEDTVRLWQRSSTLAASYRGAILQNARQSWSEEEAMDLFGPGDYVECVLAAQECRDLKLRTELLERADSLWSEDLAPADDDAVAILRAWHLTSVAEYAAAEEWLNARVRMPGEHVALRRLLARLLEQVKKYDEAAAQWHTLTFLLSEDQEAATALQRIRNIREAAASD